jgi:hypothetical protein
VRVTTIRCPQCGANLQVSSSIGTATCSYCGTTSRIQHTHELPRPLQQPPRPTEPSAPPRSSKWPALVGVLVVAGIGVAALLARRAGVGAFGDRLFWAGGTPVLFDVDRDGVPDPIGLVRYITKGDRVHLAAYSGRTGARLWESAAFGEMAALGSPKLGITGDVVLIANDRGELSGRSAIDGAPRWQLQLGEQLDEVCAGPAPGAAVVLTRDKKWSMIDAAGRRSETGPLARLDRDEKAAASLFARAAQAADPELCVPILDKHERARGLLAYERWPGDDRLLPAMRVERWIRRIGGPEVAIGARPKGTSVPMIGSGTWTTEVAGRSALTSRMDKHKVTVSADAVIAIYEIASEPLRLTAFDLATGRRRWDIAIDAKDSSIVATGLVVTGDVVLLATWRGLRAFALADGTERFVIGERG